MVINMIITRIVRTMRMIMVVVVVVVVVVVMVKNRNNHDHRNDGNTVLCTPLAFAEDEAKIEPKLAKDVRQERSTSTGGCATSAAGAFAEDI